MKRNAAVVALGLVCVGLAVATLVFRSGNAGATQGARRDARPARSKSSTPDSRLLTLEYLNGADDEKFAPIKASEMTVQGDTFGSTVWVYFLSQGHTVMYFYLQPSERVVLPLSKPVTIDEVNLESCFGSIECFAQVNLLG
jgi:hypothetical protein